MSSVPPPSHAAVFGHFDFLTIYGRRPLHWESAEYCAELGFFALSEEAGYRILGFLATEHSLVNQLMPTTEDSDVQSGQYTSSGVEGQGIILSNSAHAAPLHGRGERHLGVWMTPPLHFMAEDGAGQSSLVNTSYKNPLGPAVMLRETVRWLVFQRYKQIFGLEKALKRAERLYKGAAAAIINPWPNDLIDQEDESYPMPPKRLIYLCGAEGNPVPPLVRVASLKPVELHT